MNGLPRQSNQNRMIPFLFRRSYSKSSTLRIVLQCHSEEHTIFAPTPIGTPCPLHSFLRSFLSPELSDAEYRRESRQALTGSSAEAQMVKITPNFSSAG